MPPAPPLPYLRAFDGVRALAVGLVLLMHWPLTRFNLPLGWAGVNLFFVLSGLLITRILVSQRGPDAARTPLRDYLRRFYTRRVLRIFPLYYTYVLLVGALAIGLTLHYNGPATLPLWRTDGLLLLTYLQNWRELVHGLGRDHPSTYGKFFGHLWSLAVEEQFYLLYPLLVWKLPARWLRPLLWAGVLTSPVLRMLGGEYFRATGAPLGRAGTLLVSATTSHLDALALGGLLGLGAGQDLRRPGAWLLLAGTLALAWNAAHLLVLRRMGYLNMPAWASLGFDHPIQQFRHAPLEPAWLRLRWALTFSWVNALSALLLLWAAARGPLVRGLLENRVAVYVGRISYGIYVWHFALTLPLNLPAVKAWAMVSPPRELLLLAGYGAVVLLVASASFFGFENHFLKLKARWA